MQKLTYLALLAISTVPCAFGAQIMPDFSTAPSGWVTDRYEPNSFSNIGSFQGRTDVLGIEITSSQNLANRPSGFQSTFYNTQGRQHVALGLADSILSADLWVDASWGDPINGSVRTDMWGVMTDGNTTSTGDFTATNYSIIGFTNYGGAGRFRYFDGQGTGDGWVDLGATVNYGAWNSFSIEFTGTSLLYSVNGSLVGTDTTVNGSIGFSDVIMQAYNFADPAITGANPQDYTAHWSNAQPASSVPDTGGTFAILAGAITCLVYVRRKFVR